MLWVVEKKFKLITYALLHGNIEYIDYIYRCSLTNSVLEVGIFTTNSSPEGRFFTFNSSLLNEYLTLDTVGVRNFPIPFFPHVYGFRDSVTIYKNEQCSIYDRKVGMNLRRSSQTVIEEVYLQRLFVKTYQLKLKGLSNV